MYTVLHPKISGRTSIGKKLVDNVTNYIRFRRKKADILNSLIIKLDKSLSDSNEVLKKKPKFIKISPEKIFPKESMELLKRDKYEKRWMKLRQGSEKQSLPLILSSNKITPQNEGNNLSRKSFLSPSESRISSIPKVGSGKSEETTSNGITNIFPSKKEKKIFNPNGNIMPGLMKIKMKFDIKKKLKRNAIKKGEFFPPGKVKINNFNKQDEKNEYNSVNDFKKRIGALKKLSQLTKDEINYKAQREIEDKFSSFYDFDEQIKSFIKRDEIGWHIPGNIIFNDSKNNITVYQPRIVNEKITKYVNIPDTANVPRPNFSSKTKYSHILRKTMYSDKNFIF